MSVSDFIDHILRTLGADDAMRCVNNVSFVLRSVDENKHYGNRLSVKTSMKAQAKEDDTDGKRTNTAPLVNVEMITLRSKNRKIFPTLV